LGFTEPRRDFSNGARLGKTIQVESSERF